mmetsp:Transcript_44452/g.125723  ORF Transcript_44452/g.125723 Transcript_44452/m.125723 type:complete len:253 (-) Transcript_44452:412-1170(-)
MLEQHTCQVWTGCICGHTRHRRVRDVGASVEAPDDFLTQLVVRQLQSVPDLLGRPVQQHLGRRQTDVLTQTIRQQVITPLGESVDEVGDSEFLQLCHCDGYLVWRSPDGQTHPDVAARLDKGHWVGGGVQEMTTEHRRPKQLSDLFRVWFMCCGLNARGGRLAEFLLDGPKGLVCGHVAGLVLLQSIRQHGRRLAAPNAEYGFRGRVHSVEHLALVGCEDADAVEFADEAHRRVVGIRQPVVLGTTQEHHVL